MIPVYRPDGSPECWGRQFEANDGECLRCPFKMSCSGQLSRSSSMAPAPPPPSRTMLPAPYQAPQTMMMPPSQMPTAQPPQAGLFRYQAPATTQQQTGTYNFGQHPGESVGERLTKNIILRMIEIAFSELARFFGFYTWPPNRNKR